MLDSHGDAYSTICVYERERERGREGEKGWVSGCSAKYTGVHKAKYWSAPVMHTPLSRSPVRARERARARARKRERERERERETERDLSGLINEVIGTSPRVLKQKFLILRPLGERDQGGGGLGGRGREGNRESMIYFDYCYAHRRRHAHKHAHTHTRERARAHTHKQHTISKRQTSGSPYVSP